MNFKPQLAPNKKVDLDNIPYPVAVSFKVDGIRNEFIPNKGQVTRSLKDVPNMQLKDKFRGILEFANKNNILLDGEIYAHNRTFQEISRAVMTKDFYDVKTVKKLMKELNFTTSSEYDKYVKNLLNDMEFYCFDALNLSIANCELFPFKKRVNIYSSIELEYFNPVHQIILNSKDEVLEFFEAALKQGYEGLMLRNPEGRYKFGRCTINENIIYKLKPFEDFDAKIIGVTERFENTNESFKNELGQSVKRNTVDNKQGTGIAACFIVKYGDEEVKPVIGGTEEYRREIWKFKDSYIGRMIEYKAMMVGAKDVPRHPVFLRFREDKD